MHTGPSELHRCSKISGRFRCSGSARIKRWAVKGLEPYANSLELGADRTHRDLSSIIRVRILREHVPAVVTEIAEAVGRLLGKDLHEGGLEVEAAAEHLVSTRARDIDVGSAGGRDEYPLAYDLMARDQGCGGADRNHRGLPGV